MGLNKATVQDSDTDLLKKAVEKTKTTNHFKKKAKEKTEDAGKNVVPQSVWDKKDRSMLVGGRSHDTVELVKVALMTQTDINEVINTYKEALVKVLEIAEEVK